MIVLKNPTPATNFGRVEFGRAVRMYHRKTSANRGPAAIQSVVCSLNSVRQGIIPEVIAMKTWKTERSGYRSPIVADTEGNHS